MRAGGGGGAAGVLMKIIRIMPHALRSNILARGWLGTSTHVGCPRSRAMSIHQSNQCPALASVINRSTGSTGTDRNALENALDTTAYIRNFLDPV